MTRLTTLENKWVLVTGAASGIGLATARAFARRGARLILTDVNAAGLDAAKAEIAKLGEACVAQPCDISDEASVAKCAERLAAEGIVPDVLVNNAGIAFIGGFMETSMAQWQRMFAINVFGTVNMVRAFLPPMRAGGGARHILNVASTSAYLPPPNMAAYGASKGAVKQFTEVLAMELADSNICVQGIYPGIINTPITGHAMGSNMSPGQVDTLRTYYATKGCSADTVGEDIAKAVLAGKAHVYTGPMARLGSWVVRLSPKLARWVVMTSSRHNGYLSATR